MIGITNAGGGNLDQFGIRLLHAFPANPKEGDIVCYYGLDTPIGEITPYGISTDRVDEAQDGYTFIHIDATPQQFPVIFGASLHKRNPTLGLSCYWGPVLQKINGKYVYMKAVLRAGGEWKQISESYNGELFANGNQYTDVTGGWTSTGARQKGWDFLSQRAPSLNIGTNMVVKQTLNPCMGAVYTNKMIDVTNYNRLIIDAKWNIGGAGTNNGFGVGVSRGMPDMYEPVAQMIIDTAQSAQNYDGTWAVDLSNVSGGVYVFIDSHLHAGADTVDNTVTFRKIWLG